MKEVELTGDTIEDLLKKLKLHLGKKICQYNSNNIRYESTLKEVRKFRNPNFAIITIKSDEYEEFYDYDHGVSPAIFLISETFEEMTRRKQEEIFRSLK